MTLRSCRWEIPILARLPHIGTSHLINEEKQDKSEAGSSEDLLGAKSFNKSCLQPLLQCSQYRLVLDMNNLSLWHMQHLISSKNKIPMLRASFPEFLSLSSHSGLYHSALSEFTFLPQFFWEFRKDDALRGSWFGPALWLKRRRWQTVPWAPLMWGSLSGLWGVQLDWPINQGRGWSPPAHNLGWMQTTQNLCVKPSARSARWWQTVPGNNAKIDSEKRENEQLKDGTSREA